MTGVAKCHDQLDWFYEIHVYPGKECDLVYELSSISLSHLHGSGKLVKFVNETR